MGVPENKQVKMVANRLKSIATVWWDKLVFQRQCKRKAPINTWRWMKQLMLDRFLPNDYEKILYKMYVNCVQGRLNTQQNSYDLPNTINWERQRTRRLCATSMV
ncbi:hypothetical protein LINGRAHAP2_LOCUS6651 [Linum grandiflorum]